MFRTHKFKAEVRATAEMGEALGPSVSPDSDDERVGMVTARRQTRVGWYPALQWRTPDRTATVTLLSCLMDKENWERYIITGMSKET